MMKAHDRRLAGLLIPFKVVSTSRYRSGIMKRLKSFAWLHCSCRRATDTDKHKHVGALCKSVTVRGKRRISEGQAVCIIVADLESFTGISVSLLAAH